MPVDSSTLHPHAGTPVDRGNNPGRGRAANPIGNPPPPYTPPTIEVLPSPGVTAGLTSSLESREITLTGAKGKRAYACGEQWLAGKMQYWFYSPWNPNDFWYVLEICVGECDGLIDITIPGRSVPLGVKINVWWYPGTSAGTVDSHLAAVDGSWNEAFPDTCYAVVQLIDFGGYWQGQIQNLVFHQRCRKTLSAATGLYVYSTDGWDQWYDFVCWKEGKALPGSRIDTAAFIAAKAADVAAGVDNTCHMLLLDESSPDDVIQTFRLILRAFWFWDDSNKYTIVPDRAGAAVAATYGDHHGTRSKPVDGARSDIADRTNRVRIWYTDLTNGRQQASLALPDDSVVLDNPIEEEHKLPWLYDPAIVLKRLSWIYYSIFYDLQVNDEWNDLTAARKLGDVVTLQIPARASSFTGRLVRRDPLPDSRYAVTLLEHNDAKFSSGSLTPPARTPSTFPDPSAALGAPTGLTFTPQVDQPMPGVFLPKLLVGFTPPPAPSTASPFYGGVKVIYTINGGTAIEKPPTLTSPIVINVPEGISAVVAVSLYTVNSATGVLSTALSGSFTMYNPNAPEMIGDVSFTADGKGFYFSNAPVRSYAVYSGWSHFSMAAFTAAKMQDGDLTTTAATWGVNGVYCGVVLDALVPINPHEFLIYHSALNQTDANGIIDPNAFGVNAEYSDDNTNWNPDGSSYGTSDSDFKATLLTIRRTSSAAHRYWRFSKGSNVFLTGNITEIKIATWTGANFPYMAGFRLTGLTPARKTDNGDPTPLYTNDIFSIPTAANPLLVENFKYTYSVFSVLTGGGGGGSNGYVEIRTISPTGALSTARSIRLAKSVFATSGYPGAQDYQPLKRADKTGSGAWVNDTIANNVETIYAGTASDYKLNSLANSSGAGLYEGRVVYVVNTGTGLLWIASGGSQLAGAPAGSAITFPTGWPTSFSVGPGYRIALVYDSTATVWRVLNDTSQCTAADVSLSTQAASIGTTNLIASTPAAGLYRISWSQLITQAASTSSSLITTIGWNNGGAKSTTVNWLNGAAPKAQADTSNAVNSEESGSIVVFCASGTALTYATTYASSGATPMQYSLRLHVERLSP